MKIENAKIQNATINFFGAENLLLAAVEFVCQDHKQNWGFEMTKTADVQCFMKLREYVEAEKVEDLNGKIVRIVSAFSDGFQGFGHPIEDKFVYCRYLGKATEIKEETETEIKRRIEAAHGIVQA